jgi:hypothetical protein
VQGLFDICNQERFYLFVPPSADLTGFQQGKIKIGDDLRFLNDPAIYSEGFGFFRRELEHATVLWFCGPRTL